MFERFTDRARRVVVLAQEEARMLNHNYIGTEHILLGLIHEGEGVAAKALESLGIALEGVRQQVEEIIGQGQQAPSGHIPFTPRAKKVLELSLREALGFGHNYIGTEHILLGVVREGEGVAMAVLDGRGATGPNIRSMIQAALTQAEAAKAAVEVAVAEADRRTAGAEAVIAAARQLAGDGPMGTHHLLEAMTLVDGSLASSALGALGVAPEAVATTIDELGTSGTTDLSPEESAAQHMDVRIADDEVTIVLRDVTTIELGRTLAAAVGTPISGESGGASPLVGLWQAIQAALRDLVERVDPANDPEPGSRAAIVRTAIRNRLRRRAGG
jgi:ATP-dependent Clp protease ATP-binding subunit ClpA